MNRYRTTPGLGPSKATATTTCQKCLQKGHFSYECKASLQSRPYVSRASRSQQLRNPKLKPALTEAKLSSTSTESPSSKADLDQSSAKPEPTQEQGRGRSLSHSPEPPRKKRRRSISSSSIDSVSTISTNASHSEDNKQTHMESLSKSRRRNDPRENPRSRSPTRKRRASSNSRSRSPRRADIEPRTRRGDRLSNRSPEHRMTSERSLRQSTSYNRRKGESRRIRASESPDRESRHPENGHPPRQRSLSPYSRRIALTQAMNSGR